MRLPMRARQPYYSATEWTRDWLTTLDERRTLQQLRAGRDICWSDEPDPLITVRIPTYNTGPIVAERALASAIGQTYENLEILVIGDNTNEETADAVRGVDDPRIRFLNLPARGIYPDIAHLRRKVAGAHPMTVGNYLASGAWIAPLDDDDEFLPDHVEVLLEEARAGRYEMVYSKAHDEIEPDRWVITGSHPMRQGTISHPTVLLRSELRFMPYSMTSWKRREPSDWNLWRRMQRIGVRIGFLDRVTCRYYLSQAGRTRQARLDLGNTQ